MSRPREPPIFFIDHCLGTEGVAYRLRSEGVEVRVMVDEGFAQDAEDVSWLPVVASKGWAILTKDKRIRRRPLEHQAIVGSGAGAFILVAGGMSGDAIATAFARALPRMIAIWQSRSRPFIATVTAQGKVSVVDGGQRRGAIRRP